MKKILFFIHDLSGGGAEKVLVNLVNNIDKSKFEVTLLCIFDNGINRKYLNSEINYEYIFKNVFRGNQTIFKLFPAKFLYKQMIKKEYDIVISYMQGATTRIVSGSPYKKQKKLNWIHNEMSKKKLAQSYRSYKEYVSSYYKFDATVFVAQSAKEIFEKETNLLGNNIVKYNTVETDEIIKKSNESVEELKFDKRIINLITVGSLTKQKGYDRLLKIVNRLSEDKHEFHLYILGKGPLKKELETYVSEMKIQKYVTFLGYQENPHKYLKAADVFICSSYHEGYSTVVTESLIVGTPIITTLCSGMEEMLGKHNEYGIIVENSEDALYEGLVSVLSDKNYLEHYSSQAKKRSKHFNKQTTVKEVENLLIDLSNA